MRRNWLTILATLTLLILPPLAVGDIVKLSDSPTAVRVSDLGHDGVQLQITVGELQLNEVQTSAGPFTLVSFPGCTRSQLIGEPNLPMVRRLLSIPHGCELAVEVIDQEITEIALADYNVTLPLLPVQPSLSKSDDPASVPFEFNRSVYEQSGYYTLPLAEADELGVMRSEHIGRVAIAPVEYNPTGGTLRVYTNLTVRVTYLHPDWAATAAIKERYYSPYFEPAFSKLANYEPQSAVGRDDLVKYPVKYVIVSDRMFEAQLQPFIDWKIKKGFEVMVAYTDVIGSSTNNVRDYLDSVYQDTTAQDPAPSFVLFVGDAQQIPPYDYGAHVSDLYLCEFTGDHFPEIYYGRFSAQNPGDLQPQIDKTLEYEQYTMPDPAYLAEVTLIAGVDATFAPTHGNGQINYGTNLYFNAAHGITPHVWLYPASDQPGASAAIIQTVNDGIGFINYTAHCSHTGFGDPSFTSSDINSLTNAHKYLLGIGNCCLANTFGTDYSTPCFGEVWLQAEDKGGVGFIGGTNSTYWDEDYWWGVGYGPVIGAGPTYEQTGLGAYDGLFHDHGEPVSQHYITNDAIIYCGNLAVTEAGSSREVYYWQIYHLMGDPSIMTYLGLPDANIVTHPAAILLTATTVSVQAAPGSYVGISRNGVLAGASYVDASGTVNVPITPFGTPGVADIVVTAQNKVPYVSTMQVIAPDGPYVVYDSSDINDFAENNNGLLDAGEGVLLGVQLKNVGPDTAYDVDAMLAATDSFVTITDDTEFYGTIAGDNGLSFIADGFAVEVAANTPDRHMITFELTVSGTNRDTWIGNFVLPVHAPVLEYMTVSIDDATGNNNGILDPGETGTMVVTLANSGSGQAFDVTAVLSESDAYVAVLDDYGAFGLIDSIDGSADNSVDVYQVSADAGCPMGHQTSFSLAITAGDYSTTAAFDIIVGDREVFFADDFSYDQGWEGLGGAAEWTIGPATGGSGSDSYGGPDPATDHSPTDDNGVLGNDLTPGSGGDYASGLVPTYWVTSPPIDCSFYTGTLLRFYRWLGIESSSYDHVYLEVYDGSSWITLFENGATIDESQWNFYEYDVSAYADVNPDFQIRFGLGGTDGSMQYCGWNIDDLELKGYDQGGGGTAVLSFQQSSLVDSLLEGDTAVVPLRVYNIGDGTARIRFTESEPWLTCDNEHHWIPPGDSMDFPVCMHSAGLGPGDHAGLLHYTSNDDSNPAGDIPVSLHIYMPVCVIPQTSIEAALETGQETSVPLTINNTGPGILTYAVGCQALSKDAEPTLTAGTPEPVDPIGQRPADAGKSEATESYYPPVTKGSGGPDLYGYTWADSDEPGGPAFSWIDISATGTVVTLGDDDHVGPFEIGFNFPYYESLYDQLYIGSNGIVTFGAGSDSRFNGPLPDSTVPNNLLAIWWDDLDPRYGGTIAYYSDVTNQRFIVSFDGVPNYYSGTGTGSLSFQLVLYSDGHIIMQYGTMDPGLDAQGLTGASVGIENAAGDDGLQVVYNAAYMHDNLAISFVSERWLWAENSSGEIEPYGSASVDIHLDATELDNGLYTGQVDVATNDPNAPMTSLPVSLTVESYLCGDADGDADGPNVADLSYLVDWLFLHGPEPPTMAAANVNSDNEVNVADLSYLVEYLFLEGPPPVCGPVQ